MAMLLDDLNQILRRLFTNSFHYILDQIIVNFVLFCTANTVSNKALEKLLVVFHSWMNLHFSMKQLSE